MNQKYTQGVQCHIHHLHECQCCQRHMWLLRHPPCNAKRCIIKLLHFSARCASNLAAVKYLHCGKMSRGDLMVTCPMVRAYNLSSSVVKQDCVHSRDYPQTCANAHRRQDHVAKKKRQPDTDCSGATVEHSLDSADLTCLYPKNLSMGRCCPFPSSKGQGRIFLSKTVKLRLYTDIKFTLTEGGARR